MKILILSLLLSLNHGVQPSQGRDPFLGPTPQESAEISAMTERVFAALQQYFEKKGLNPQSDLKPASIKMTTGSKMWDQPVSNSLLGKTTRIIQEEGPTEGNFLLNLYFEPEGTPYPVRNDTSTRVYGYASNHVIKIPGQPFTVIFRYSSSGERNWPLVREIQSVVLSACAKK